MRKRVIKLPGLLLSINILLAVGCAPTPKMFEHPGMIQSKEDLEFMKQKVAAGEEPWKSAYEQLCREPYSSMDFQPRPVAHVVRGAYG